MVGWTPPYRRERCATFCTPWTALVGIQCRQLSTTLETTPLTVSSHMISGMHVIPLVVCDALFVVVCVCVCVCV